MTRLQKIFLHGSACLCLLAAPASAAETGDASTDSPFHEWGKDALATLNEDLWIPRRNLYAERAVFGGRSRRQPAFMWGVGVQVTALAAAAKVDKETYLAPMRGYADAIDVYWQEHKGIHGYDVLPGPKDSDRYYDDNAWLVLGLIEVYEITGEKKYLEKAEDTFRFVMSGEDEKLGGGLYWRENELESKNTCTNAPAIVSALRLHQLTERADYLETAKRVYAWTCKSLQDDDGLFLDHMRMDGSLDRRKFTYNTALMIRANVLFHEIKGEQRYLEEAKRISDAAVKHWVRDHGGIADGGRFAHFLVEAFLELHRVDGDERWLNHARNALTFLHANVRDPNGRYGHRWDREVTAPLRQIMLLDQASAARAFWVMAGVKSGD